MPTLTATLKKQFHSGEKRPLFTSNLYDISRSRHNGILLYRVIYWLISKVPIDHSNIFPSNLNKTVPFPPWKTKLKSLEIQIQGTTKTHYWIDLDMSNNIMYIKHFSVKKMFTVCVCQGVVWHCWKCCNRFLDATTAHYLSLIKFWNQLVAHW